MKTITIDNKHYIPARIVMLPTEDKSTNEGDLVLGVGNYLFLSRKVDNIGSLTKQYLYLVCDLPIEEGDYWINLDNNSISNDISLYKLANNAPSCKKVIATTDSSLWVKERMKEKGHFLNKPLPQFNQSFIKEFVERQGKDVDVLVEVDNRFLGYEDISGMPMFEEVIKLNTDNTVNLIFK